MTTSCYYDPHCVDHDPGVNHSERSARLKEIVMALKDPSFKDVRWPAVAPGRKEDILLVHTPAYVDFVFDSVPQSGYREIEVNDVVSDYDEGEVTVLCPKSGDAVLYAVGSVTGAVDDVLTGKTTNAFCAVRPPGHHALPDKAMGFCVFNNIAIGARYAQKRYNLGRVAIVDFDLHHGNGTQAVFEKDPSVFFCSTHQLPLWPESGYAEETGAGNILNVPMEPHLPREAWLQRWKDLVLGRLEQEAFDCLFVSAGFDAHKNDHKSCQSLETDDYFRLMADLLSVAERKCRSRTIVVLEGGYDIHASASSAAAVMRALLAAP
ncbi:MAG: histone deacetylase family protein [Alphaproteobacteria bacterium]|nr:histone deacetylase family protein [Alphaproteobacteria bacterium]